MSSSILPHLKTVWTVESLTPDEVNSMLSVNDVPIFVKMDIEGGEYDLIPAARALWDRLNLTPLVSTHQNVLKRFMSRKSIRHLTGQMSAALRDYDVSQVRADGIKTPIGLSLLHKRGLAAPLGGSDWLFTRRHTT
jgi:hypothetical protein